MECRIEFILATVLHVFMIIMIMANVVCQYFISMYAFFLKVVLLLFL